jgi:hypothetical protein
MFSIVETHKIEGTRSYIIAARCLPPLSTMFQLDIVAVSFIGGGHRSTGRKPTNCRKSLTNFIK